jgi:hypothetical protein
MFVCQMCALPERFVKEILSDNGIKGTAPLSWHTFYTPAEIRHPNTRDHAPGLADAGSAYAFSVRPRHS